MSMTGRVYRVGSDNRYFAVFDMAGLTDIKARHSALTRLAGNLLMGTWLEHQTDGALDSGWITTALEIDQKMPKKDGAFRMLPNVGTVIFTLNIAGDPGSPLIPPQQPRLDFTFEPTSGARRLVESPRVTSEALSDDSTDADDPPPAWQVTAPRTSACPGNGDGIVVAMVDTGVQTTHIEFAGAHIVRGPRYDADGNVTEAIHADDPHGHGTRMASAVVGRRCGVARDATLYMVAGLDEDKSTCLLGLLASVDDAADGPNGIPVEVLSLSLEMAPDKLAPGASDDVALALQNVAGNGTLVLIAAGNHGDPAKAECASPLAGLGGSLAIGGCNQSGEVSLDTGWSASLDLPHLYAFAIGVEIPERLSNTGYSTYDGQSSYATAFTAGVAASLLGREPALRGDPAACRRRLRALAKPATDADARPLGSPAGIARICGDQLSDPRGQDSSTVTTDQTDSTTTSAPGSEPVSTSRQEQCMSDTQTENPEGNTPGIGGAEGDEGFWIVWSVDPATGKCASIVGYMWSQKDSTTAGAYHEYFIFDDDVFNGDYKKLPFVKTLTFWRMDPQPSPITNAGDFKNWVESYAPVKIGSSQQAKRYAYTTVNSTGWP